MTVKEYGSENKDTVLLLHGGGLSWWNYLDEIELLKDKFRVVIPILDGHNESSDDFTSIEDNADRIIKYIDDNFGGRVKLIGGLSLGGQILLEILSKRNAVCEYAVIESALALPMTATHKMVGAGINMSYGLIGKKWFSKLQFKSLHIKAELFERYYNDTKTISKENYIAFLKANSDYKAKKSLSKCRAKVLVVVGGREISVMKRSARIISELIPDSELDILKGYYHGDLSINHADEYTAKIIGLIGHTDHDN